MIGILGGTFDPVHYGHLRPALEVQQALGLRQLRFIPLRHPSHRPPPELDGEGRRQLLRAAVAGQSGYSVDDRELRREGPSYTVDTLRSLRADLGAEVPLCLLLGLDAFLGFSRWHHPEEIMRLAHLVLMRRPPVPPALPEPENRLLAERRVNVPAQLRGRAGGSICEVPVTQLDISSTAIRGLIRAGKSPRFLLPDPVLAIIQREGLYR